MCHFIRKNKSFFQSDYITRFMKRKLFTHFSLFSVRKLHFRKIEISSFLLWTVQLFEKNDLNRNISPINLPVNMTLNINKKCFKKLCFEFFGHLAIFWKPLEPSTVCYFLTRKRFITINLTRDERKSFTECWRSFLSFLHSIYKNK